MLNVAPPLLRCHIISVSPVGIKPARDLQSASTVVAGLSNTNLNNNNNNDPTNSNVNISADEDNKINSSSRVEIGQVVSMVSTDSVFITNTSSVTHGQGSIIESPVAQPGESTSQVQIEAGEQTEQDQSEGKARDGILPEEASNEESVEWPTSNVNRNEVEECDSLSKLPKVIVEKSIDAAVKRLSLRKQGEVEGAVDEDIAEANGENRETQPCEGQASESHEQESHGQQQSTTPQVVEREAAEDVCVHTPTASVDDVAGQGSKDEAEEGDDTTENVADSKRDDSPAKESKDEAEEDDNTITGVADTEQAAPITDSNAMETTTENQPAAGNVDKDGSEEENDGKKPNNNGNGVHIVPVEEPTGEAEQPSHDSVQDTQDKQEEGHPLSLLS